MEKERLYARDVLKRSWILFSEHIGVFLSVSLVYIMIALATGFTLVLAAGNDLNGTLSAEQMSAARWPFKIIMVLAGLYTFIMCHSMINGTITAIRTSDGRPETAPRFSDFFMVNKSVILGMFTTIFRIIVIAIPTLVFSGIGYFVRENDYAVMACSVGVISVSFTLSIFTAYATFHSIEDGVSPWNAVKKSCIDVSKDTTTVFIKLAQAGEAEAAWQFYNTMWNNQPAERRGADVPELGEIAQTASHFGAKKETIEDIKKTDSVKFGENINKKNIKALEDATGEVSTPTIFYNGVHQQQAMDPDWINNL